MPLGRQGKRNHNIGGVRLDCSSEIVQEYWLGYGIRRGVQVVEIIADIRDVFN